MQVDFRKRGIGIAIAVTLIIPLALGLMFYPPAHMELKNMPCGVLSLDEGVGETALGDQLVSKIESGDFAALAQGSEEDAEEGTEAKTSMTDILKFEVFESQLEANVSSALSSLGVDVAVEVIDQGPAADAKNASMLSGMLSQMMVLMPLLICSMLAGAFAVLGFGVRGAASTAERMKRLGLAWAVDAVAALAVALMSFWLLTCVAGLPVEFAPYFRFAWLTSFLLMVFFSGCACIRGRVAIAMGVIIILLGMTSGYLPYEGLPMFWQDWVCPWAPQFYLGNGLREVVFAGGGIWNQGTIVAGIYALVGILLACLGLAISARMVKQEASEKAVE